MCCHQPFFQRLIFNNQGVHLMPGFCGIYRQNDVIDSAFNVQTGVTPTVEKDINLPHLYIRQYITPKFENDKIFRDLDDLFYCTDGVILNAAELYPDYAVQTVSSLLPEMFRVDGLSHIEKLRGVFSGLIIDKVGNTLHLFTEHLGSKRLYYYYNHETKDFFFASDLKVVVELMRKYGYATHLSEEGAYCILTFGYMIGNRTLCSDVQHLEPGTILTLSLDTGNITKQRYYEIKNTPYIEDTDEHIIEEIDKRFTQAIVREYSKDLEYGYQHIATLSGGLDSRMTLVKGIMQGYKNIRTITFSESGYLDEKIAEKIASDLGCDHVFHALDNGNFLMNLEDVIKTNDGLTHYPGLSHGFSTLSILNIEKVGLLHTGQLGDAVFHSYLSGKKHVPVDVSIMKRRASSTKLIDKHYPDICTTNIYDSDELFSFYERGINGIYGGNYATQNFTEFASPFLDVDFINYIMRVHPKLRYNNKLYSMWINQKVPDAGKYIWEKTGERINCPEIVVFCKRVFRFIRRKILPNQRLVSMNPFTYWYSHNEELRNYFHQKYEEGINRLSHYPELMEDSEKLYMEGTALEKTQVLTLLEAVKWLHLS